MNVKRSSSGLILATGVVGALGAFLMAVGDVILLGRPISGPAFFATEMGRGNMVYLPQWRLALGSTLGVVVVPLQIVGFWQVLEALKPAGRWRSWPVFLIMAHMLIVGGAVHSTFMFVGTGLKAHHSLVEASGTGLPEMLAYFFSYQTVLYLIAGVELIVASSWFVVAVLSGKTAYPRWMAVLNPFILVALTTLLGMAMPAPVGGYLAPTQFNSGILLFFVISTAVLLQNRAGLSPQPLDSEHNERM